MQDHFDVSESVALARGSVSALRSRLEADAPDSKGVADALREIEGTLDSLRSRYGLFREVLYRTNDIVFAKGLDGRYAMVNPKGEEFFGKRSAEIVGATDRDLLEPVEAERTIAADLEVMRTQAAHTAEETFTLRGTSSTLLTTTTCWFDDDRVLRGVISIAQDVTERRRSERESHEHRLRMGSVVSEIVISEERLRRALAAELHNGLGQDIALAKLKLAQLRSTADQGVQDTLSSIEALIEEADRSLRAITFQISPPSLHDLGLVAALEWLAEDMGRTCGLTVRVENQSSPAVEDERVRVILFRAVRELLVNAATHSGVRAATVRLIRLGSQVCITVHDTGVGFDAAVLETRGRGLFGLRQQLEYVGGSLHIHSTVGKGTSVTVTGPTKVMSPPES